MPPNPHSEPDEECPDPNTELEIAQLPEDALQTWHREQERRENIRSGRPYLNTPSPIPAANRHKPSSLLKCHRKTYYQTHNAPAETPKQRGLFWYGTQFETNLATPFLNSQLPENRYLQNSLWTDYTIEHNDIELEFRGETDPAIVDAEGTPLHLTEIKTTSTLDNRDTPQEHHRAQLHAYLHGLRDEYDNPDLGGTLLYAARDTLALKLFPIEFDHDFWTNRVLAWAAKNTRYRSNQKLPPDKPERDWECHHCPYRRRCGKDEFPVEDAGPTGLLPRTTEYPRARLTEYLNAHPGAKLTPTLAYHYPEIASRYGIYKWRCRVCGTSHSPTAIAWRGDPENPPLCPQCQRSGTPAELDGPNPPEQAVPLSESNNDDL